MIKRRAALLPNGHPRPSGGNRTHELPEGPVTWEYRFSNWNESGSTSAAPERTAEGWIVVSSRVRLDNSREYLLKRPRK